MKDITHTHTGAHTHKIETERWLFFFFLRSVIMSDWFSAVSGEIPEAPGHVWSSQPARCAWNAGWFCRCHCCCSCHRICLRTRRVSDTISFDPPDRKCYFLPQKWVVVFCLCLGWSIHLTLKASLQTGQSELREASRPLARVWPLLLDLLEGRLLVSFENGLVVVLINHFWETTVKKMKNAFNLKHPKDL